MRAWLDQGILSFDYRVESQGRLQCMVDLLFRDCMNFDLFPDAKSSPTQLDGPDCGDDNWLWKPALIGEGNSTKYCFCAHRSTNGLLACKALALAHLLSKQTPTICWPTWNFSSKGRKTKHKNPLQQILPPFSVVLAAPSTKEERRSAFGWEKRRQMKTGRFVWQCDLDKRFFCVVPVMKRPLFWLCRITQQSKSTLRPCESRNT